MALGLVTESSGGGDFTPLIKYDARAGRVFKTDRTQDGGGNWNTDQVDITQGFATVMDLENVEVGYAYFAAGTAPIWSMVPLGSPLPPRPEGVDDKGKPRFKQTFRMKVKLSTKLGGDVRELASQAKVVISAIDALHSQFEAEKGAHPGQLPIVSLLSTIPVKTGGGAGGQSSTNYQPVFEITTWISRPPELTTGAKANQASGSAAQSVHQMKATSQAAPALAEEF